MYKVHNSNLYPESFLKIFQIRLPDRKCFNFITCTHFYSTSILEQNHWIYISDIELHNIILKEQLSPINIDIILVFKDYSINK